MKTLAAAALLLALAVPAFAGETVTTPPLALPEPETPTMTALPHSPMTEAQPLALPEPEQEAIAPYKGCGSRETVYLTN